MNTPKPNRLPPPYIEPVTIDEIRYYLDNIRNSEVSFSITYLFAVDANYDEIWRIPVYVTKFDTSIETDVQEVYPISLDYNRDKHSFVIENEAGDIYTFDLSSMEVQKAEIIK
ncbi:hypothetical protein [Glaciecola sp. 1036]|uniref:hypothetical protein n=1 Tax=Alteromonadaceae TaxID=72275 RepID=UPI003CFCACC1